MAKALIVATTSAGTTDREQFVAEAENVAQLFETEGVKAVAELLTKKLPESNYCARTSRVGRSFTNNFLTTQLLARHTPYEVFRLSALLYITSSPSCNSSRCLRS